MKIVDPHIIPLDNLEFGDCFRLLVENGYEDAGDPHLKVNISDGVNPLHETECGALSMNGCWTVYKMPKTTMVLRVAAVIALS
jgi:hypothetical protein